MPSSRDLPDPGIKLESFLSPALAGGLFTTSAVSFCDDLRSLGQGFPHQPSPQPQGCFLRLCWVFAVVHGLSFLVAHELSCPAACGISVPQPGIEPLSPALGGRFSTAGPPGKPPQPQCCPRPCPSPTLPFAKALALAVGETCSRRPVGDGVGGGGFLPPLCFLRNTVALTPRALPELPRGLSWDGGGMHRIASIRECAPSAPAPNSRLVKTSFFYKTGV